MDQIANELHKPIKKVKQYRKVIVYNINETWGLDLVDMQEFADVNNGFRYLLTCIDIYSRFAWAIPMKNKTGNSTAQAIQKIINDAKSHPRNFYVDEGKEFYNKDVDALRKKYDIEMYSTYGPSKVAHIERFNRTLKTKMFKQFTINGNNIWFNILDKLVNSYNNTIHRTIKHTPIDVFKNNIYIHSNTVDDRNETKAKFKVGDRVRISYKRGVFDKGYLPNWSQQLYIIDEVIDSKPITYKIKDAKNEIIKGCFYDEELQLTKQKENVYLVNKILKNRTRKGVKECLVSWIGYDDTFNSWEPAENIEHDLKNIGRL